MTALAADCGRGEGRGTWSVRTSELALNCLKMLQAEGWPSACRVVSVSAEDRVVLGLHLCDDLVWAHLGVTPIFEHDVPNGANPIGIADVEGALHGETGFLQRIENQKVALVQRRGWSVETHRAGPLLCSKLGRHLRIDDDLGELELGRFVGLIDRWAAQQP